MLRRKTAVIRTYPTPALMQGLHQGVEFEDNHLGAVYSVADVDCEIARLNEAFAAECEKQVVMCNEAKEQIDALMGTNRVLAERIDCQSVELSHLREGRARDRQEAASLRNQLTTQEARLIETGGQCFRVARQFQKAAGDNNDTSIWLEGRLKRLEELEGNGWRQPANGLWEDSARAAEERLRAEEQVTDRLKEWDTERRVLIGRVNALEDSRTALKKNLATAERQIRDLMAARARFEPNA